VAWEDAKAYCQWVGRRLPTEAEFEYATRAGTDTEYWWGDEKSGWRHVANLADESAKRLYPNFFGNTFIAGYDDGYVRTASVGSFEANPFGLYDMTGNVHEYTADVFYHEYYAISPRKNPSGPSDLLPTIIASRGGGWDTGVGGARSATRSMAAAELSSPMTGFRCAKDASQ
jgi:formylglycine-generating enzyme required for sulfatase activity